MEQVTDPFFKVMGVIKKMNIMDKLNDESMKADRMKFFVLSVYVMAQLAATKDKKLAIGLWDLFKKQGKAVLPLVRYYKFRQAVDEIEGLEG